MSASHDPLIVVVNDRDEPIGQASKEEAQEKALIHRIVNVMVEDSNGRVLLQLRGASQTIQPLKWDSSVGGHVDAGEDYLAAAKRETYEEIGVKTLRLKPLGKYRYNDMFENRHLNRFYQIYKGVVPVHTKLNPDAGEVKELRWFSPDALRDLVEHHPDECVSNLVRIVQRFYL